MLGLHCALSKHLLRVGKWFLITYLIITTVIWEAVSIYFVHIPKSYCKSVQWISCVLLNFCAMSQTAIETHFSFKSNLQ